MTFTRNVMVDIISEDCNSGIGVPEIAYSQNELRNTFILAESEITYKANLMSEGFFKVPRQITDDPRYRSARIKYQKVLLTILENAAFSETTHAIGTEIIKINVGQFCISERRLVDLCNKDVKFEEDLVDRNIVTRAISYFEKCNFVSQKVIHGKTLLTVLISDSYKNKKSVSEPESEPKVSQNRASKEEVEDIKEVKKVITRARRSQTHTQKIDESKIQVRQNVFLEEKALQSLKAELGEEFSNECLDFLSNWKLESSSPKANKHDDYRRIKRWVITAVKKQNLEKQEIAVREARLQKHQVSVSDSGANEKLLENVERTYESQFYRIDVTAKGAEFTPLAGQAAVEFVSYGPYFKQELEHMLRKKSFFPKTN